MKEYESGVKKDIVEVGLLFPEVGLKGTQGGAVEDTKKKRKKNKEDALLGREGQSVKENLKHHDEYRILLLFLSYISYLDILIFGKLSIGNAVFFSLKKSRK